MTSGSGYDQGDDRFEPALQPKKQNMSPDEAQRAERSRQAARPAGTAAEDGNEGEVPVIPVVGPVSSHTVMFAEEDTWFQDVNDGAIERVRGRLRDEPDKIDAINQLGMSALHFAAGRGHYEIAELLINAGAKFFADKRGRWPSSIATRCEVSDELCDLVVDAEARALGLD